MTKFEEITVDYFFGDFHFRNPMEGSSEMQEHNCDMQLGGYQK